MDASEVDAAIDELKTGHHKERHEYIEMVAQLRRDNRRLLRALWLARADRAKDKQTYYTHTRGDGWVHRVDKWIEIEHKCLNKAEEYK